MTAVRLPPGAPAGAPRLERVHQAMDARAMEPHLASVLGPQGRRGCHVVDAKYEPGVRCTVLYRVGERLVRGDLLGAPAGDGDEGRPVVPPGVRLTCFPDDPELPHLAGMTDPVRLAGALRDVLPGAARVPPGSTALLRYRPGKRATLGVAVQGTPRTPTHRLVVKAYHDGRKAAAVAAEALLLHATADPAAPLRFAPVRGCVADLSLVVQERVSGTALDAVIRVPGPAAAAALERAAAALAALHHQTVVSHRIRGMAAELDRFGVRSSRIASVDPATGSVLGGLATRLVDAATVVPPGVVGLVHGDCKPSQFLLRGPDEVVLLDLDSCGQADPAADVGTFLATLRQHLLREVGARRVAAGSARAHAGLARAFLRAYLRIAGTGGDDGFRQRVRFYEAVALERKALRCFARAPRAPLTRALVAAGHARLDRLEGVR